MCLVIVDVNCLPDVFDKSTKHHEKFEPVLKGIDRGYFKMVYGGTKYKKELPSKFLRIINRYKDSYKIITVSDKEVDAEQKKIESNVRDSDFDDPHLPAIAIVSQCHIICTNDLRFVWVAKTYRKIIFPKDFRMIYYTLKSKANTLDANSINKIYGKK